MGRLKYRQIFEEVMVSPARQTRARDPEAELIGEQLIKTYYFFGDFVWYVQTRERLQVLVSEMDECRNRYEQSLLQIQALQEELNSIRKRTYELQYQ
ncbi:hypothetical protein EVAR_50170_1 [Eumeta japonica]|uniref:Uncharacterized protein n=1 Tax=Eumeta variegata TaxID=151549 RepID=A0A4C1YYG5_EUMVA|nr:hypothetical protein EVAR_50170_1 [Eumeta japonica]